MSDFGREYAERFSRVLVPLASKLEAHIAELFAKSPRIDRICSRAKSIDRFVEKAEKTVDGAPKYEDPLAQIQDQIGARIITFYTSDVDRIASEVNNYFRAIEEQDLIPESESEFGYVGKHYVLFIPSDVLDETVDRESAPAVFELQIKTLFQHAWSEANHDLGYKPGIELTAEQKRKLAFTAAQAWGADHIFSDLSATTQS